MEFNITLAENGQSHGVKRGADLALLFVNIEAHIEHFTIDDSSSSLRSFQLIGYLSYLPEDVYQLVLQPRCPQWGQLGGNITDTTLIQLFQYRADHIAWNNINFGIFIKYNYLSKASYPFYAHNFWILRTLSNLIRAQKLDILVMHAHPFLVSNSRTFLCLIDNFCIKVKHGFKILWKRISLRLNNHKLSKRPIFSTSIIAKYSEALHFLLDALCPYPLYFERPLLHFW